MIMLFIFSRILVKRDNEFFLGDNAENKGKLLIMNSFFFIEKNTHMKSIFRSL